MLFLHEKMKLQNVNSTDCKQTACLWPTSLLKNDKNIQFLLQASDLYEKLFSIHVTELSLLNSDWLDSWQPCWIDPVLSVLCGNNKTQRKHIVEVSVVITSRKHDRVMNTPLYPIVIY